MRVVDSLLAPEPAYSFEFFPPKTTAGEESLFRTVGRLNELEPTFISITCGAGGSTRGKTVQWADRIHREFGLETVVHLTCLGLDEAEVHSTVDAIEAQGLRNILVLRGDVPLDEQATESHCHYASDMIRIVRERYPQACIGAACYPEGHTEAKSMLSDLENLRKKADAGADYFITQLFFDNRHYFEFVGRARSMGITQPILPGIMPIQDVSQVKRFTEMCGASIPTHLLKLLEQYDGSSKAVFYIGVAHAIAQCDELLRSGAPGIHFFTLNRSPGTRLVLEALRG
ncbi:MAG: methylenetetrahydrofolate reductase [NAD(P)H] [Chthonomonas sp.]|nr:methylenetetrahydrofolate reductase [NAD(P)H] [Chthonomonas sp.]